MFKSHVTITFSISTPKSAYPKGTSHQAAAHIDKLNFSGNTESLLETLCNLPYSVRVEPVADGHDSNQPI